MPATCLFKIRLLSLSHEKASVVLVIHYDPLCEKYHLSSNVKTNWLPKLGDFFILVSKAVFMYVFRWLRHTPMLRGKKVAFMIPVVWLFHQFFLIMAYFSAIFNSAVVENWPVRLSHNAKTVEHSAWNIVALTLHLTTVTEVVTIHYYTLFAYTIISTIEQVFDLGYQIILKALCRSHFYRLSSIAILTWCNVWPF